MSLNIYRWDGKDNDDQEDKGGGSYGDDSLDQWDYLEDIAKGGKDNSDSDNDSGKDNENGNRD